jgi:tetratricopeptide (TPR) repeat protein
MKPASPSAGRDEVIAVPDWLFEPDHAGAEQSADALLSHAEGAVETWERRRDVVPQADARTPSVSAAVPAPEADFVLQRRRSVPAWLWALVGAAAALGAGSFFLEPGEPPVLECRLPVRTPDAVLAAMAPLSAPVLLVDDSPARPARPGIRRTPSSEVVQKLLAKGTASARAGRYYSAWGYFEKARALSPRNPDVFFGLALAQYELGNKKLAALAAVRALTWDPEHPNATLLLGFIEQDRGDFQSSRRLYEQYLSHAPEGESARELHSVLARLPKK